MDGGKFKSRLSEVNARAVSRGQNELVGKFKMGAGDMVSVSGPADEGHSAGYFIYFHSHLRIPAISTDSSQVGVALFPSINIFFIIF